MLLVPDPEQKYEIYTLDVGIHLLCKLFFVTGQVVWAGQEYRVSYHKPQGPHKTKRQVQLAGSIDSTNYQNYMKDMSQSVPRTDSFWNAWHGILIECLAFTVS